MLLTGKMFIILNKYKQKIKEPKSLILGLGVGIALMQRKVLTRVLMDVCAYMYM